jgi:hypothetical protein
VLEPVEAERGALLEELPERAALAVAGLGVEDSMSI